MAALRTYNLILTALVLALTGCATLSPGVARPDYIVQRSATGQDELIVIENHEVVPAGPSHLVVQPDRLSPEDDIHSVRDRIWSVTGLVVGRRPADFAKTGQPDRIHRASAKQNGWVLGDPIGISAFEYASPSYSPNRKRIIYACREYAASDWEIWVMNADGAEPAFLHHGTDPAWLGNGAILFADRGAIWRVDLNGARLKKMISDDLLTCSHPAPSPSADVIAFVKGRDGKPQTRDIWLYSVKRGVQRRVTIHPARDDLPRWDTNGKYIRFRSTRDRFWGIWRAPAKLELGNDRKGK